MLSLGILPSDVLRMAWPGGQAYRARDLMNAPVTVSGQRLRAAAGPGKTLRLFLFRGCGRDFSEADRALLTLLRPHLYRTYVDAERSRHPGPELTSRHWEVLELLAAGHTNTQIARRLGVTEGTVRKHLENIYGRLGVSSRTAAVMRAFSDLDTVV